MRGYNILISLWWRKQMLPLAPNNVRRVLRRRRELQHEGVDGQPSGYAGSSNCNIGVSTEGQRSLDAERCWNATRSYKIHKACVKGVPFLSQSHFVLEACKDVHMPCPLTALLACLPMLLGFNDPKSKVSTSGPDNLLELANEKSHQSIKSNDPTKITCMCL